MKTFKVYLTNIKYHFNSFDFISLFYAHNISWKMWSFSLGIYDNNKIIWDTFLLYSWYMFSDCIPSFLQKIDVWGSALLLFYHSQHCALFRKPWPWVLTFQGTSCVTGLSSDIYEAQFSCQRHRVIIHISLFMFILLYYNVCHGICFYKHTKFKTFCINMIVQ